MLSLCLGQFYSHTCLLTDMSHTPGCWVLPAPPVPLSQIISLGIAPWLSDMGSGGLGERRISAVAGHLCIWESSCESPCLVDVFPKVSH